FLSGDVHSSYLAEVVSDTGTGVVSDAGAGVVSDTGAEVPRSRLLQVVCSPIRNPLPRVIRVAQHLAATRLVIGVARAASRLAGVDPPPLRWRITRGPWFDNMLATLWVDGRDLSVSWARAGVGATGLRLRTVFGARLSPR